jgi:hypothetical protein
MAIRAAFFIRTTRRQQRRLIAWFYTEIY